MSARDAAAAGPNPPSPIRWALAPIRARLMLAAALAATGTALTLAPLAGMVRIAQIALGGASGDIWTLVIASVISLFAGMALILAGELAAHLADNRLTHHLPGRRAAAVPGAAGLVHAARLGRGQAGAAGRHRHAAQPDRALLHRRGTRGGRHRGVGGLPVRHGLAPGHRRAAAVSGLLPVPAPRHEGQRRAHAGIRGTARPHQQRHGRVRQRHTRGQGLRRHWPRAWRLSRGGRRLRPRLRRLRAPAGGHHGPCPRDDRAGDGAGPGAGVRPAVRASGLDDAAGRAALRAGRAGHLRADAAAAHTAA